MRKIILILLSCQLLFIQTVWSAENLSACSEKYSAPQMPPLASHVTDVCAEALKKNGLPIDTDTSFSVDKILPMAIGCLSGMAEGAIDQVKGLWFLVELFLKEIPKYLWEKVVSLFDSDDSNAVAGVNKLSDENTSLLDKATKLAKEYLEKIKSFLKSVGEMIKNEFQSFLCYPKDVQAKMICRLISEVFFTFYSPMAFIKGLKVTQDVSKAAKGLLSTMTKVVPKSIGKVSTRINEAKRLMMVGKKAEEISGVLRQIGKDAAIVTKDIDGELVYMLKEVKNGKTFMRELFIEPKTKFFSSVGKGDHAVQLMITEGAKKKGAMLLVDVNDLGKTNYFTKGLSAGDDYLKAVSDSLRKSVQGRNVEIFKTGGDEISVFIEGMSRDEINVLAKKISRDVVADKTVQEIFQKERKAVISLMREAKASGNKETLEALTKRFNEIKRLDGSVSVGGKMLKEGDTLESLQTYINNEGGLARVKASYKKAKGYDYKKYGAPIDNIEFEKAEQRLIPPVLPVD